MSSADGNKEPSLFPLDDYNVAPVEGGAVSSADKSNELSVTLLDNVNITPVVEDVTQTPQNVASTLSATVFSTSPATLKIYQGRKNSQCDRYGTTVVTDSQGNVVATKTGNSTTTYSGALGDFQINDETGAVTPMEEVFTVTVTAPDGYYIASVTSTTASALTAKDDYDFSDPVQEYTLTGFTSDQTVYVTYSASTLTLKNHKGGDTLASFYSAGVTFDVSEGAINNSSSWTKASNSTGQIVSTYIASINEGSKFSTLTLDTSGISCEYALTDIKITKDGEEWDILDTGSLPFEDDGTVVLNFKDNAVVAADSAASDIVVNLYYTPQNSIITIEHDHAGLSTSNYNRADVKLTVSEGTTQAKNSAISVPYNSATPSFTVKTGSVLSSLSLSGYVFNDASGLGVSDITVYKNDVEWDVIDDSAITYPIIDPATIPFKSSTIMPEDNIRVVLSYAPVNGKFEVVQQNGAGTVATTSASRVFINSLGSSSLQTVNNVSSASNTAYLFDSEGDGITFSSIKVTAPNFRYFESIKLYVDGVDKSSYIVQPDPGVSTFSLADGFSIAQNSDVKLVVTYKSWNTISVINHYDDSVTSPPDRYARCTVFSASGAFSYNNGGPYNSFTAAADNVSTSVLLKPDVTLHRILIDPQPYHSVSEVYVTVNGVRKDGILLTDGLIPSTGSITVYFADNTSFSIDEKVEIHIVCDDWDFFKLTQKYVDSYENHPSYYGSVTAYSSSGGFVYGSGGPYNSVSLTGNETSKEVIIKPGTDLSRIVVNVPQNQTVSNAYVLVNGEKKDNVLDTSALPTTNNPTLYFADDFIVSAKDNIEVVVEYSGWGSIGLNHKYVDSYQNPPATLGSYILYSEGGAFVYGSGGPYSNISLTGNETHREAILKPDSVLTRIHINPPENHTIADAYITVNGVRVDDALDTGALPTTNSIYLYFKENYSIPASDHVEIFVEYSGWGSIGLNHKYVDSYQNPPATLGSYILYSDGGAFVYGNGGPYGNISLTGNESHREATLKPDAVLDRISVSPPENHTIADAYITVNGVRVDDAIDTSALPTTNSITLYFKDNYSVPASDHVEVFVEYSGWGKFAIHHKYADSYQNPPPTLGSYVLYSTGGAFVYGNGGPYGNISLTGNESSRECILKPNSELNRISISPPENHSIVDAYVTVNGTVDEDALIWPDPVPTSGGMTLYFTEDYIIKADDFVEVFVVYGGWNEMSIHHRFADSVENPPATLGSYVLYSTGGAFVYGNGGPYGNISLTGNQTSRDTILKPDAELDRISISPPENHSIVDAYVTVNGEVDEDALIWPDPVPTSGGMTLYFTEDYIVSTDDKVEVHVVYGEWNEMSIHHRYADSVENPPETLGSYILYSNGGAFVYGNGGPYGNISLTGNQASKDTILKPDAELDRISIPPPSYYSVVDAYVTVNGEVDEDALIWPSPFPTSGHMTLYFTEDYIVSTDEKVEVHVVYGEWNEMSIHHRYADSVENPPATLGSYVLYSTGGAFVYGNGGPYGNISLTGNQASKDTILKPDVELDRISISPPSYYSVVDAYVTVNGEVDEDALIWPSPFPTSGHMTLYFTEDYIVSTDEKVEVHVVYGEWNEMSIHHRYADSVENPPATLGSYVLYSTGGAFVYGNGGPYGNISLTGNQASKDTILKPDAELDRISISPPSYYSVVDAYVTVNGEVDEDALIWPSPFPTSGHMTLYFTEDYIVSNDEKVEVHVVYGEWNEMSIHHRYADSVENPPATLGSYVLYSTGGAFVYGNGGPYGNISLTGNQASKDTILKPDVELDRISISPPSYYSVVDAYVTVNGEVDEDALIWPSPIPTSGYMTLYFTEDYIVSTDEKVEVHVVYGEWNNFTIEQKYADSVDNAPSTYGSVISYSTGGAFVYGNGGPYSNISLTVNNASVDAVLKPDSKLNRIYIQPPVNHSIVDVYVLVNGVEDDDALKWPSSVPTSGSMTLYFADNYIVPAGNDIMICIEYGDWNKITINQTNLVSSELGSIKLSSDRRSAFIVGNSRYTTYTVNTESHESVIHPDALVNGLVITPPGGLSIISATATITDKNGNTSEWKTNGSDVITLNDDGTVTFTEAKPTGDVTINVTYGAKLYIRTNNEGSAVIDGKDIPTELTFLSNITSDELTLAPTANSGWKIESVLYSTNASMLPTVITAENGEYKISNIDSDVYVYVKTVPDEKNITARQDGSGKVTLTYNDNDTVLSGTAADIGTAAIGSEVFFTLTADADTKITDVTVNGTSIGTSASFTMPSADAEIVVYTDVELPDTLWLAARKTGSGTAQAVYGDTKVTLEPNARILATRLESGKYTIEVMPTEGSRIVSVSIEDTELETATLGAYVYHLDLVDDNVTVTVETVKDSEFVVYAKINVDGKASVNGTALSTDYKLITEAALNGTVTAELSLEAGYVLIGARCGIDKSALTAVEFTDGRYDISNITSDMYLDISVARKPVITVNRTGNGSIYTNSGSTDVSNTRYEVMPGSDHTFEFIADSGYELVSVTVKRGSGEAETVYSKSAEGIMTLAAADFEYAINDVTEDCEITAVFSQVAQSYTLHVIKKGSGSGKFTLDSDEYTDSFAIILSENTAPVLGISANTGSKIVSVKIGDSADTAAETTLSSGMLSIPAMTKDVYVIVEFSTVGTPDSLGGTPDTGDDNGSTAALIIMINSFVILALIAGALYIRRRKNSEY